MAEDIKNIHILLKQLTSSMAEVKSAIQNLQTSHDRLCVRITESEHRVSKIKDDRASDNQRIQQLEQRLTTATGRIDDLENRSQRNNVRIIGFSEGVEEGNPMAFLQKVFPGLSDLEVGADLEMEQAHRALGARPIQGQCPRAFIIKLLRYPTCEYLLLAARLKGQVKWQEHQISLYPDLSRDLQMKWQQFQDVRKLLQVKRIKYGMFHPAILKITVNGETMAFSSLEEAKKFISPPPPLPGSLSGTI
uniref:L1 transposable element RRM domain-containing protein n=1 Tax=Latimeria chalumnae TaxID=7897 RepID=H2ZSV1_LATCH